MHTDGACICVDEWLSHGEQVSAGSAAVVGGAHAGRGQRAMMIVPSVIWWSVTGT